MGRRETFIVFTLYTLLVYGNLPTAGYGHWSTPWSFYGLFKWLPGLNKQHTCEAKCLPKNSEVKQALVLTYSGNLNDVVNPDFNLFEEHHRCAGRSDNASIIAEGRKRIQIFEYYYGIDLSTIKDQDLLDGRVPLLGGKLLFRPYRLSPAIDCRVILESNPFGSWSYENVIVSDAGWVIEAIKDVNITGPGYKGSVSAGSGIYQGEFLFDTSRENPYGGRVLIKFESKEPQYITNDGRFLIWKAELSHPVYGKGRTVHFLEADPVTSKFASREVQTFPIDA
ncbi:uncharacterized protein LOC106151422 [Lingula anatina]|uniref:Uncharacterized protein LOC106151422 n=1 Tax=Lingula anatina TaxID=7574 RepID=A0A1S3H4R8_LINAN|nr:uncharacterized protein LOC106151422 [Lingula anatina]|eukprot:XP_013380129.1 uncharacterized protein LOC106151422 [Lingula anatina]